MKNTFFRHNDTMKNAEQANTVKNLLFLNEQSCGSNATDTQLVVIKQKQALRSTIGRESTLRRRHLFGAIGVRGGTPL